MAGLTPRQLLIPIQMTQHIRFPKGFGQQTVTDGLRTGGAVSILRPYPSKRPPRPGENIRPGLQAGCQSGPALPHSLDARPGTGR